ncbi:MAG: transcriptional regulator [Deltaproteobacteria bacterium SG8_13]|nr:MAG: transcriptional regulator [Deltaproteobacteria bacterium SG8_13]
MNQNQAKTIFESLSDRLAQAEGAIDCTGLSGAAAAYLIAGIQRITKAPLLVVVPSSRTGASLRDDLRFFMPESDARLLEFPAYNILPYKSMAYHSETTAKRISTLYRMMTGDNRPVTILPVDALLQKVIPRPTMVDYAELVMAGEDCERDRLVEKLLHGGYAHAAVVEEPGDYAVRGGLVDVFSPLYDDPLRMEFFGNVVESIHFFSATSQRRMQQVPEAVLLPAREAVLEPAGRSALVSNVRQQATAQQLPVRKLRELVERIKVDGAFPGIDSLLPLVYEELSSVFDYLPSGALVVNIDPAAGGLSAEKAEMQIRDEYNRACENNRLCVEPDRAYFSWQQIQQLMADYKQLNLRPLQVLQQPSESGSAASAVHFDLKDNAGLSTELRSLRSTENPLEPLADWIAGNRRSGAFCVLVCRSKSRAERLRSLLLPYDLQFRMAEGFHMISDSGNAVPLIVVGRLSAGFVWPSAATALITEEEIFGSRFHRPRRPKPKPVAELIAIEDLKTGDHVVHLEHGIGQYGGLVKLELDGTTNDFLLISYRDDDRLYLPVDRMNTVQKYMGVDGVSPVLDKMGGRSWSRVKARVKKSAEKIAGELLKLYAARKVARGCEFDPVDDELKKFEAGFTYEETADQQKAIRDALTDMADPIPMDRLICGDVGYGKTEVALRASFVAVHNGKQVAILVPTTVLAEQHFATFTERFERFPLRIARLSRFRPAAEQRQIVKQLRDGRIDIVIGTHRLLSSDVAFKDLGLLILDEEQRFGVKHKEKLKRLRKSVDVLTLTATPIPRTLHMSLMGIRDISVISTPPEYRQSIITYVSAFDPSIIAEAVRREIARRGQIFFIHNRIETIENMARKLQRLVPEVRLDTAHGRMPEDRLEKVMLRFLNKEIDMLVCTTIVESGLDIPSANTILVNRADRFGLAQMYQLRGRVGRSDEQAYAYLFIPHESILTPEARKRLKVLMEHSDLGSGFQIAMSDLQIRGGGTILGASQSGHIAAVGYEMFLQLMENAIAELKGEPVRETLSPEINIPLSAFIPESYIADIDQRLSAYRRLARMTELNEIAAFKSECLDRYGALPEEVANLLMKIMLKVMAIKAGVNRLDMNGARLVLGFSEQHQKNPSGIVDMILADPRQFALTPEHVLQVRLAPGTAEGLLSQAKNILKRISRHVNN